MPGREALGKDTRKEENVKRKRREKGKRKKKGGVTLSVLEERRRRGKRKKGSFARLAGGEGWGTREGGKEKGVDSFSSFFPM